VTGLTCTLLATWQTKIEKHRHWFTLASKNLHESVRACKVFYKL